MSAFDAKNISSTSIVYQRTVCMSYTMLWNRVFFEWNTWRWLILSESELIELKTYV